MRSATRRDRCSASGCARSSSTGRPGPSTTPPSSTSACRTPARTARCGRWPSAASTAPADDDLATVWTIRGRPARLPARRPARRRRRHRAVLRRRRRQADLRREQAAEGRGHPEPDRRSTPSPTPCARSSPAPMVKGEMSTRLTAVLDEPYLRFCGPCDATHLYEQPFRLSALRAGLELQPGTSPPVLQPIPGLRARRRRPRAARRRPRLPAPARAGHAAARRRLPRRPGQGRAGALARRTPSRWTVDGERRWLLADDVDRLGDPPPTAPACSARSTSSCRPATGRCWWTTRPGPRTSGAPSAGRAASWSTARSSDLAGAESARRGVSDLCAPTAPARGEHRAADRLGGRWPVDDAAERARARRPRVVQERLRRAVGDGQLDLHESPAPRCGRQRAASWSGRRRLPEPRRHRHHRRQCSRRDGGTAMRS